MRRGIIGNRRNDSEARDGEKSSKPWSDGLYQGTIFSRADRVVRRSPDSAAEEAGAEARSVLAVTARLKPCPDTKLLLSSREGLMAGQESCFSGGRKGDPSPAVAGS